MSEQPEELKEINKFYLLAINVMFAVVVGLSFETTAKFSFPSDNISIFIKLFTLVLIYYVVFSSWLGHYLCDAKDISNKIAIERLIADNDFKLIGAIEKVNHNAGRFWDEIIKEINKIAEDKKLNIRYTSLFELHKISIDSRKSLNKLKEEVLDEKKRK